MCLISDIFLIILAGFPITTALSGISFVTTLPAPTKTFFPIFIPGNNVTFAPITVFLQTVAPPTVLAQTLHGGYGLFVNTACGLIITFSPKVTPSRKQFV